MLLLVLNYLLNNINQSCGVWEIMTSEINTMIHSLLKAIDSVRARLSLALILESLEPSTLRYVRK